MNDMNIYGFSNWLSQQVCMTVPDMVIVHAAQIRLTQRHLVAPRSGKKENQKKKKESASCLSALFTHILKISCST